MKTQNKTVHRSQSVGTLLTIAEILVREGFEVSDIVIPESFSYNPWFETNASNNDIMKARREARGVTK